MKLKHVVLGLAMVCGFASAAQAVVIDFNSESSNPSVASGYEENGFRFEETSYDSTAPKGFNVWPGEELGAPGATVLVIKDTAGAGGTAFLSRTDGGSFRLDSVDLFVLSPDSYGSVNVTFTGLLADSSTVEQTFTLVRDLGSQTFAFDADFTDLVSVSFMQSANYDDLYGFTNVNVTPLDGSQGGSGAPVPEPATMLLFASGLLGLAGVSRRKN